MPTMFHPRGCVVRSTLGFTIHFEPEAATFVPDPAVPECTKAGAKPYVSEPEPAKEPAKPTPSVAPEPTAEVQYEEPAPVSKRRRRPKQDPIRI